MLVGPYLLAVVGECGTWGRKEEGRHNSRDQAGVFYRMGELHGSVYVDAEAFWMVQKGYMQVKELVIRL